MLSSPTVFHRVQRSNTLNGPDDLRAKRGENDCLRANACGAPARQDRSGPRASQTTLPFAGGQTDA